MGAKCGEGCSNSSNLLSEMNVRKKHNKNSDKKGSVEFRKKAGVKKLHSLLLLEGQRSFFIFTPEWIAAVLLGCVGLSFTLQTFRCKIKGGIAQHGFWEVTLLQLCESFRLKRDIFIIPLSSSHDVVYLSWGVSPLRVSSFKTRFERQLSCFRCLRFLCGCELLVYMIPIRMAFSQSWKIVLDQFRCSPSSHFLRGFSGAARFLGSPTE